MTLARSAAATGAFELRAAIDLRAENAEAARRALELEWCSTDLNDVWRDPAIDVVLVATPAATHVVVADRVLRAGKHALVEKPLALSALGCARLGALAQDQGLTLMVGHTFMYSPHVRAIRQLIEDRGIGAIQYMHLQRLAFGRFRDDVNVTWNLGPHDVSILNYWAGVDPVAVRCVEQYCTRESLADVAFITIDYGAFVGHAHLSCVDPCKVRTGTVAGSLGGVTYDDVTKRVAVTLREQGASEQLAVSDAQPLQEECRHFAESVLTGNRPRTDDVHATAVVAVLEAATTSAAHGGAWIPVPNPPTLSASMTTSREPR